MTNKIRPTICCASEESNRQKTLREINSENRGVFEQENGGGCKLILDFLVVAYENRQAMGGRDWRVSPYKSGHRYCLLFSRTSCSNCGREGLDVEYVVRPRN